MVHSSPDTGPDARSLPNWPTCDHEGTEQCSGVQVDGFGQCLAHLDSEQLDEALSRIHPSTDLDVRGTTVSPAVLARVLDAVRDDEGRPNFGEVLFDEATFASHTSFRGAIFNGNASFREAAFTGIVSFSNVTFTGHAFFRGVSFASHALYGDATFTGDAWFDRTTFTGPSEFIGATFTSGTWFSDTTFTGDAVFNGAIFAASTWFDGATFTSIALFSKATFTGLAVFDRVTFETAGTFGLIVARTLRLRRTVFRKPVVIQVTAAELDCNEARFDAGAVLRLRNARASFRRAVFAAPSAITDAGQPSMAHEATDKQETGLELGPPALTSLEGVDVADLVLTDIDLSPCRFAGAHHLDKLRLEGDCQFAWPPQHTQLGRRWPPVWRWTRRQLLAEERDRRATGPRSAGWSVDSPPVTPLNAKRVAALYRDLRKAQEDNKNEPGAADFYYGEMEMRRADRTTAPSERLILLLYWLVSGYGLRMARALTCLAALVATATVALHVVGFAAPRPSLSTCLLYAAESTVSLEPKLAGLPGLTWQGEVVRLIMRLLGPLLLGLALLAVRNRVKR